MLIGSRLDVFHPLFPFHDPFFPRWSYLPPAQPQRADDVVTQALISVLTLDVLGDGLRDVFEPRTR